MNLLSGLEKFGLKADETTNLFEEEKKNVAAQDGTAKEAPPEEDTFLLDKAVRCTVCDKVFKTKTIKNGRVKRMEPDFDLRPRFEYIDTVKYGVVSCPFCGYTSLTRYFEHLSGGRRADIASQSPRLYLSSQDMSLCMWLCDGSIVIYDLDNIDLNHSTVYYIRGDIDWEKIEACFTQHAPSIVLKNLVLTCTS